MSESKTTYFAAANSYNGFLGYFDRVFRSENFDRIFVLKGGPGTGKSSLMRALSKILSDEGCEIEEILCSSDPKSLDGVIAKKGEKRIAILDGTSPHERDAVIPGAIDEIINLGDNWDDGWLIGKKRDIISLSNEKKKAYKTAYDYLYLAGEADNMINGVKMAFYDKSCAKIEADLLLQPFIEKEDGKISTRLISSFGRFGDYKIQPSKSLFDKQIKVQGDGRYFLKSCADYLINNQVNITLFPTAKDPECFDAILLESTRILIIQSEEGEINGSDFLNLSSLDKERCRLAEELKKELLIEAARWFKIAAELHSSLEDIYSAAMDFSKNDRIISDIYAKIDRIFKNT